MKVLPSVLKHLLEDAQGIWDHLQFSLTFFHLTSQEVFWAEVIRSLEYIQIIVREPSYRCRTSLTSSTPAQNWAMAHVIFFTSTK
jgi:hypothetical protein